ncbi:hypothetical protein MKZ38_007544 [Zalerion maritima]|uniref:Ceramide glucosyltransferase n=1 Tax=Zalerion maritima TaxID=339359 RepID=A0AAD5WN75_9PEZI|nr:hypothetical protein MKZ38_007544 [Zalerion maritima]
MGPQLCKPSSYSKGVRVKYTILVESFVSVGANLLQGLSVRHAERLRYLLIIGLYGAPRIFVQAYYIRSLHPEIRYIWSPVGSKNVAQLVGALAAKEYEYVMTVDDDVSIPSAYRHPVDMIDEHTKAVAFPLKAIDEKGEASLFLVGWQDCEYRMAGLTKLAETRVGGVSTPHGAGWFVERDTFVTLMTWYRPMDFIAEDSNAGFGMMKMGKRIVLDGRVILETEVPPAPLQFQRTKDAGIPIIVTTSTQPKLWLQAGLLTLVSILPLMIYKYIKCRRRPDMQPGFWAAITYPVYKLLYSTISVFGAVRVRGVFWLDKRFEENPAFLVDEVDNVNTLAQ